VDLSESLMSITVDSLKDSALVYVVHNWISPLRTSNTPKNIKLSTDRYWTVDGILPNGFHANALISYDGRFFSSPYTGGFLDNDFLSGIKEDSIVLMYKPLYGGDWTLLKENIDYIKTMGISHTDEFGNIKILNLSKGQYCFGIYDYRAGVSPINTENTGMQIYPNPAKNSLNVKFKETDIVRSIQIFDSNGKLVKTISNPLCNSGNIVIDDIYLPDGIYILRAATNSGMSSSRFAIEK
jgi:hypothetical protein